MRRTLVGAAAPALLSALALGGCGAQTKTVTAGSTSAEGAGTSPAGPTSTTSAPDGATASTGGGSTGPGSVPSTTRTAPEPAFAQGEEPAQQAKNAAAVVRARGYTPGNLSEYHPSQTLGVLVGTRTGSAPPKGAQADGYGEQVFFFVDGRFIGTDASEPSAAVKVVSQGDTEAAVSYALYRPGDPLSSPSAGHAIVHFQLDNGHLAPLGSIPPVHSSQAPSRL